MTRDQFLSSDEINMVSKLIGICPGWTDRQRLKACVYIDEHGEIAEPIFSLAAAMLKDNIEAMLILGELAEEQRMKFLR